MYIYIYIYTCYYNICLISCPFTCLQLSLILAGAGGPGDGGRPRGPGGAADARKTLRIVRMWLLLAYYYYYSEYNTLVIVIVTITVRITYAVYCLYLHIRNVSSDTLRISRIIRTARQQRQRYQTVNKQSTADIYFIVAKYHGLSFQRWKTRELAMYCRFWFQGWTRNKTESLQHICGFLSQRGAADAAAGRHQRRRAVTWNM